MSNQLTILNNSIRSFDNLYSLKDLHKISGGEKKHEPYLFIRLETTQELITEIKSESDCEPVKTIRGTQGGTYACEELVIAYAMWISPKFHLIVLRAFLAMHRNQPQQLALPEPQKFTFEFTEYELQELAWLWFAFKRGIGHFPTYRKGLQRFRLEHERANLRTGLRIFKRTTLNQSNLKPHHKRF